MKFLLVALFAAVVCSASADLSELLGQEMNVKVDKDIIEKVKCYADGINAAVKGTATEKTWNFVQEKIAENNKNIVKAIEENEGPMAAHIAAAKVSIKSRKLVSYFVVSLKAKYAGVYSKIGQAYQKCFH